MLDIHVRFPISATLEELSIQRMVVVIPPNWNEFEVSFDIASVSWQKQKSFIKGKNLKMPPPQSVTEPVSSVVSAVWTRVRLQLSPIRIMGNRQCQRRNSFVIGKGGTSMPNRIVSIYNTLDYEIRYTRLLVAGIIKAFIRQSINWMMQTQSMVSKLRYLLVYCLLYHMYFSDND